MIYKPFQDIHCAYQLHYHFCFQTKFRRPIFSAPEHAECLAQTLSSICERNNYHLLEQRTDQRMFYCLLSLRPEHTISDVARTSKTNLSREFNTRFAALASSFKQNALWSRGYFVRSVGKASRKAAEMYIHNQAEHHGTRSEKTIEITRWINLQQPNLSVLHATFDLSYHVVLVTAGRRDVFDEDIAPALFKTVAEHAEEGGFYVERMSLLPDHIHLLIRITPSHRVKECVIAIMNHSWQFMADRYQGVLKNTGAYDLWESSCYIGTVGEATTAQIKNFLARAPDSPGHPRGLW
jgi:putative transposase